MLATFSTKLRFSPANEKAIRKRLGTVCVGMIYYQLGLRFAEVYSQNERSAHSSLAPTAKRGMCFVGADVGEVAPAAFAFGVGADFDGGGEGFASGEVEVAEDEEFSKGGEV